MEVLIFTTSVRSIEEANELAPFINSMAGKDHWNFALDDRDKILRIVSVSIRQEDVVNLLERFVTSVKS